MLNLNTIVVLNVDGVELIAVQDARFFTRALGLNSGEVIEEVRGKVVHVEFFFFEIRFFFRKRVEVS